MIQWAQYETCGTCQAVAGEPCRQVSKRGVDVVHGQVRVMARRLVKPHRGRVRNPNRVRGMAASAAAGGHRVPQRGNDLRLDDTR